MGKQTDGAVDLKRLRKARARAMLDELPMFDLISQGTIRLDELSDICGYFVWDYSTSCNNNGYGCTHPDNPDRDGEACAANAACNSECPIAPFLREGSGGGDAIMAWDDELKGEWKAGREVNDE